MSIEWKEDAVCYVGGGQRDADYLKNIAEWFAVGVKDFQLNTIKQGDYIKASELDTEQKYNDVVEVFGLFGFYRYDCADFNETHEEVIVVDCDGDFIGDYMSVNCKRKLTFNQIMAIGELKRLELEREKSAPKITPDLTTDLVQNPSHYQFFEGVEVIEIIASSMTLEQFKGYCLGNRIKYRLRAGNKDKLEQEIAKSDKYVELYDEHKHLCRNDGDLK